MNKEVGRELGRAVKSLADRIKTLEDQGENPEVLAKLSRVEAQADLVTHLDFQGLIDTFTGANDQKGAALAKSVGELAEMLHSASDQASMDQLDTRETLQNATKTLVDAIKSVQMRVETKGIEAKLAAVGEAIAAFSVEAPQLVEALDANTQAVQQQTEVITEIGAQIVVQMRASRIIEFDENGDPIGVHVMN